MTSDAWKKTLDAVVPAVVSFSLAKGPMHGVHVPAGRRSAPGLVSTNSVPSRPPSVQVVLKVTQTRAFDTEAAGSSYATGRVPIFVSACGLCIWLGGIAGFAKPNIGALPTGFVVDKARGLILTNRHVVTPGGPAALGPVPADQRAIVDTSNVTPPLPAQGQWWRKRSF